jgi:hypothetical protein
MSNVISALINNATQPKQTEISLKNALPNLITYNKPPQISERTNTEKNDEKLPHRRPKHSKAYRMRINTHNNLVRLN